MNIIVGTVLHLFVLLAGSFILDQIDKTFRFTSSYTYSNFTLNICLTLFEFSFFLTLCMVLFVSWANCVNLRYIVNETLNLAFSFLSLAGLPFLRGSFEAPLLHAANIISSMYR